jgi:hypothetical protein
MASRTVRIGEHDVELRMTLLSVRRLEQAMGVTLQELGERFSGGAPLQSADDLITLTWACVAHAPELAGLDREQVAGMVGFAELATLADAIGEALGGEEEEAADPPPKAPGKAAPRRERSARSSSGRKRSASSA